jgi:hypothetical protein
MKYLSLLCCGMLLSAAEPDTRSPWRKAHNLPPLSAKPVAALAVRSAKEGIVHVAEVPPKALILRLGDRDIGIVHTRVRYDTWIILPPEESITGAGSGDTENWQVKPADANRATNLFHVQPSKENTRTNLNLRSSAGHYYSLLLIEDSECKSCQPDLKVFIEPTDMKMPSAQMGYYGTSESDYQKQIGALKAKVTEAESEIGRIHIQATREVETKVAAFRAEYPLALRCSYETKFGAGPFQVDAICTDGTFTYIKARSEQIPSLYTDKDGKPGLTQFRYVRGASAHDGTYVIESVVYRGELRLGNKKLKFTARG